MIRRARPRAMAVLLAALLAACSSPGPKGPAHADGSIVVPLGGERFLVFEAGAIRRYDGPREEDVEALEAGSRAPTAGALDLEHGWAAAGYENRIAIVQLAEASWSWIETEGVPTALGLHGDLLAAVHGDTVSVYGLLDGKLIWRQDAGDWLRSRELGALWHALPLSKDEFVLVCHAGYGTFTDSRTVLQRIDRSRGSWRLVNERALEGISLLQACASDGAQICLAGVQEGNRLGPQGLLQTLVVQLVDPATLAGREIVRDQRHDRDTAVTRLVLGSPLVALVLNEEELKVYRIYQGISSTPLLEQRFGARISVAWLSPSKVVVTGSGEPQVLEIK